MCYELPCKKDCSKRELGCHSKCFKYMYWVDHKPKTEKKIFSSSSANKSNDNEYKYDKGKRKADSDFFLKQIFPHMTINGEYIGIVR